LKTLQKSQKPIERFLKMKELDSFLSHSSSSGYNQEFSKEKKCDSGNIEVHRD
jgi:hypothetical protein